VKRKSAEAQPNASAYIKEREHAEIDKDKDKHMGDSSYDLTKANNDMKEPIMNDTYYSFNTKEDTTVVEKVKTWMSNLIHFIISPPSSSR
jgi:hypothetical protein